MTSTLHEDQNIFLIVSHLILRIVRNILHKYFRENQKAHFMFSNIFFLRKSCFV